MATGYDGRRPQRGGETASRNALGSTWPKLTLERSTHDRRPEAAEARAAWPLSTQTLIDAPGSSSCPPAMIDGASAALPGPADGGCGHPLVLPHRPGRGGRQAEGRGVPETVALQPRRPAPGAGGVVGRGSVIGRRHHLFAAPAPARWASWTGSVRGQRAPLVRRLSRAPRRRRRSRDLGWYWPWGVNEVIAVAGSLSARRRGRSGRRWCRGGARRRRGRGHQGRVRAGGRGACDQEPARARAGLPGAITPSTTRPGSSTRRSAAARP